MYHFMAKVQQKLLHFEKRKKCASFAVKINSYAQLEGDDGEMN